MTSATRRQSPDSGFLLILMTIIWVGMIAGFGGDIAKKYERMQGFHYPLIVHIHAAAYVGWMVLVTVQILLVRAGKHNVHRALGLLGTGLMIFMIVIGPWAEIDFERSTIGTPHAKTAFIVIAMAGVLMFGVLTSAGLLLRHSAEAHKRLMMLALISITTAGFGRWLAGPTMGLLGQLGLAPGFLTFWLAFNGVPVLLALSIIVRDLVTLRRVVPAYLWGMVFMLAVQLSSCWLYFWPGWKPIAEQWVRG